MIKSVGVTSKNLVVIFFNCPIRAYYACFTSSCTAKHTFFSGKSVVLHLCEGPGLGHTTDGLRERHRERKKREKNITRGDLNPQSPCCKVCTLPLRYNHCLTKLVKYCDEQKIFCCQQISTVFGSFRCQ